MRRCRLVVGVDTGPMHAARAVKAPHVVLLSGMHFGRFLPNAAPPGSVVAHPLDCYFCEGECRHERAHCMADMSENVIRRAIDDALQKPVEASRIYLSHSIGNGSAHSGPGYAWDAAWVGSIGADIISG